MGKEIDDLSFENAKWKDLMEHLIEKECDKDEYLRYAGVYGIEESKKMAEELIWDDQTTAVACFWEVGVSEGYYMLCKQVKSGEEFRHEKLEKRGGIVGKFWSREEAERATNLAQRFVNSL